MALNVTTPPTELDPAGDLALLEEAIVKKQREEQVVKKLATHIGKVWTENQKNFKNPRLDMVKTARRVRGEYDPDKLSAIRAFQGSEVFIRSGESKARAAESWIKDIYRGDIDIPWSLEPTAEPDLPDETIQAITADVQMQAATIEQELMAAGLEVNPDEVAKQIQAYYEERLAKEKEEVVKTAKRRMDAAAKTIRDQNQESGWNNAFKDFLYYFVRYKFGIIKGPILTKKSKQVWQPSEVGGYELKTVDVLVNDVYCVSPFNFFPSRGMRTINDGDVIEIHELSKQAIADLIGVPGYSEEELRAVLREFGDGSLKGKWFSIEDETAVRQATKDKVSSYPTTPPTQNSADLASDLILAQEFYGTVSGKLLIEWGLSENLDAEKQYQANCWKIGDHVIKAVINPDPLGRKPYHVSSWAKNPEWIVGEGLLEFAAPVEDALNAVGRAIINNVAIASGPMAEVDKDRVDTKIPIYPWRQIESTSMQMKNEGAAVVYYQPQMHGAELTNVFSFWSKLLDEMTVPAYAQGASQSGVTAGTATVFTQLLAAASRSIKAVVANIDDDIITPYITMCYDNIKEQGFGDIRVVAKGVSGLQMREQQAQRKVEYLQIIANPTYQQILGAKNIGAILAQIAKSNDLQLPDMDRIDGIDSAEETINALIQAQAGFKENNAIQQNGQVAQGGGEPTKAQSMRPDGAQNGVAT